MKSGFFSILITPIRGFSAQHFSFYIEQIYTILSLSLTRILMGCCNFSPFIQMHFWTTAVLCCSSKTKQLKIQLHKVLLKHRAEALRDLSEPPSSHNLSSLKTNLYKPVSHLDPWQAYKSLSDLLSFKKNYPQRTSVKLVEKLPQLIARKQTRQQQHVAHDPKSCISLYSVWDVSWPGTTLALKVWDDRTQRSFVSLALKKDCNAATTMAITTTSNPKKSTI